MKQPFPALHAFAALALLSLAVGCEGLSPGRAPSTPLPDGSTYLLHLPGIAGDTAFDRWWMNALADRGVADRAELYDWTCNDPGIPALQAHRRNHGEAVRVCNLIRTQRTADPTGRFILTAESGGTGVAVWALEHLPADVLVDEVVLVAPAISPDYDLTAALRHVRGRMVYTSSGGDWFVLGVGTTVFGTMDGKNTDAAGFVGFYPPKIADPDQYAKLIELKYDSDWIKWGDFGTHTGGMSPEFARHVLAPMLLREMQAETRQPTEARVQLTGYAAADVGSK
ncbi:MAG TPA: hypothetical protein VLJ39_20485 [Tepidisphaeraceae bacterium]|nr:hypothetical protein [Tepidisphaeraceae bacterium]